MTCAHCAALSREVGDLRAEVEAWRSADAGERRDALRAERLHLWKQRLELRPRAAEVAMMLAETAGAVSTERLTGSTGADGGPGGDLAKVYVCQVRAGIQALGLDPGIEVIRGYGYRMDRASAARLIAALDGGRSGS